MMVYEHYWRMNPIATSIVLRTYGDPVGVTKELRQLISSADPEMAIPQAITMEQIVNDSVAPRRFETSLAIAFAAAALVLASLGIYGVVSFSVSRRTQEIGVRMALGARAGAVLAMVLRRGMIPVLVGTAVGVCVRSRPGDYSPDSYSL